VINVRFAVSEIQTCLPASGPSTDASPKVAIHPRSKEKGPGVSAEPLILSELRRMS